MAAQQDDNTSLVEAISQCPAAVVDTYSVAISAARGTRTTRAHHMPLSRATIRWTTAASFVMIFNLLRFKSLLGNHYYSFFKDEPMEESINDHNTRGSVFNNQFPRWPVGDNVNITTVLSWFNFAGRQDRRRKFTFENMPAVPALLVSNQWHDAKPIQNELRRALYSLVISKPVADTMPHAQYFIRDLLRPLQEVFMNATDHYVGSRDARVQKLFQLLDDGTPLPLVLDVSDMDNCATDYDSYFFGVRFKKLPVWSFAIRLDCKHAFALPYAALIHSLRESSEEWSEQFDFWKHKYPWDSKVRAVVWRGGPTGKGWRQKFLHMLSQSNHTSIINVSFAADANATIPFEDFQKYTAVFDIDGNSWSERFPRLLCMNSVVIKVQPQFLGYLDDLSSVRPYEHFIPAPLNETIFDIIEWTLAPENQEQVKKIVSNAQSWCKDHMTRSNVEDGIISQLVSYVDMLTKGDSNWTEIIKVQHNSSLFRFLFPDIY